MPGCRPSKMNTPCGDSFCGRETALLHASHPMPPYTKAFVANPALPRKARTCFRRIARGRCSGEREITHRLGSAAQQGRVARGDADLARGARRALEGRMGDDEVVAVLLAHLLEARGDVHRVAD